MMFYSCRDRPTAPVVVCADTRNEGDADRTVATTTKRVFPKRTHLQAKPPQVRGQPEAARGTHDWFGDAPGAPGGVAVERSCTHLLAGERGRWFVEDQQARLRRQGPGDFDQLLGAQAESSYRRAWIAPGPQTGQHGSSGLSHPGARQQAGGEGEHIIPAGTLDLPPL